uniref:Plant intracellular Ras-group-related LRR protein 9-like n=1 Tax=Tanacetum cinerariifolium TaxID=118510 RepID=A0A6L2M748_TANCI|nr:hypothetical protein [Tanacetum cinerariifolium]
MDPNPKNFPILSYVMARIPSMKRPTMSDFDIEQPQTTTPRAIRRTCSSLKPEPYFELTERMPHLTDPHLLASMRSAVADVSQTRSLLKTLGDRPDHEAVDIAKSRLKEIDMLLSNQLDEIALSDKIDPDVEKRKKAIEHEKKMHKALISLDQMHESYDKLLYDAEKRLEKLYESVKIVGARRLDSGLSNQGGTVTEEVKEEVVAILTDAMSIGAKSIDLSERRLPFLPEAFGKIRTLIYLNISNNQLEVIPDSIAGLENLEELNTSSNVLESLPDSIGCLHKLKILDVSSNKLCSLPDSISKCRSLIELDAGFNRLTYLPTKIGYELVYLKRLSIPLNKDYQNPSESYQISRLRELDVSNNQIQALPVTFGRLDKLTKLNIDQNPLVIPPKEVVEQGIGAVKVFMAQRWFDMLVEEEERTRREQEVLAQASWLSRSTSWLAGAVVGAAGTLFVGGESDDPYLDEER